MSDAASDYTREPVDPVAQERSRRAKLSDAERLAEDLEKRHAHAARHGGTFNWWIELAERIIKAEETEIDAFKRGEISGAELALSRIEDAQRAMLGFLANRGGTRS